MQILTHPGFWILAQAEVTFPYPLFCQVPRHRTVLPHSAVEVPITHPSGSPQFEEPTKLFQSPSYLSPSTWLCHWQASHASGRQQSDHSPQQAPHKAGNTRARPALRMSLLHRASAPSHMQGQAGIPKSLGDTRPCWSRCFKRHPSSFPPQLFYKGKSLLSTFRVLKRGSRGCGQAGRAGQIVKHFIQRVLSPSPASKVAHLQGAWLAQKTSASAGKPIPSRSSE